jgi:hypothetical protein
MKGCKGSKLGDEKLLSVNRLFAAAGLLKMLINVLFSTESGVGTIFAFNRS